MKNIIFVIALSYVSTPLPAQIFGSASGRAHLVQIGFYNPTDAKSGIMLGYMYGIEVDENVSIGFSGDLYMKSYTKESIVATDSIFSGQVVTVEKELDFSSSFLPIQANVTVKLPLDLSGFIPFIAGGLGVAFLMNKEVNYLTDESDTRFFMSFVWNLGSGVKYQLGSKSNALIELFYNRALLKGSREKTEAGLPVYNEINMSGIGLRIGLSMEL